jgi:hypothetical protein
MGMFDNIFYEGKEYQTKDTPCQTLDKYKIEHDQDSGHIYLWHEDYDAEWVEDNDGLLGGYLNQFNHRWVHCWDFDGNIRFYRTENKGDSWIEYSALFMDGQLLRIKRIDKQT